VLLRRFSWANQSCESVAGQTQAGAHSNVGTVRDCAPASGASSEDRSTVNTGQSPVSVQSRKAASAARDASLGQAGLVKAE
jgi:hypothetical protein